MSFSTDKQTLDDLNIFGRHGSDSLYNMFNRCSTRGGSGLLEEMFNYPLAAERDIVQRLSIFRYFCTNEVSFPFDSMNFDPVETYLSNTDARSKLVHEEVSLGNRLENLISIDPVKAIIYNGIKALVGLLSTLSQFTTTHFDFAAYDSEREDIKRLLATITFQTIWKNGKLKFSHNDMVEIDALLRFKYEKEVRKLLHYMYLLDIYTSIRLIVNERGLVFPELCGKHTWQVKMDGVFHPQVKEAKGNNIEVTAGGNVLFLTGANMAGKSTFMKSFSIALYLAHMGFPVPATKMEFSVLDGIYTTINLPDNLGMGASHFYAEVLRVKKIAQELSARKNLLIVFDELFRGTNVKDAYEATIAVTKAFATKTSSLFVISTHIIEAAPVLAEQCTNVRFLYLPTKMEGNKPIYTYQLGEGVTDDRHGMIIVRNEGILDILDDGLKANYNA
ncbi:MutS-related protein [Pedobacter psychroterrae]|uniref:DNA mismatch repair protein n=1 Tax=Pedobacter psychroterrae TaxID=2530453 RepID=A0A4R0NMU6_9SPHI|nr:DNA mismatch repair protein [Pedobacter psychroterrae]TCD01248.1 DNA mismatch repair protein [Pedobacter psychroterrae]